MIYVFYGPDSFSRREALAAVKARLDEDGALSTNTVVMDGRRVGPEEVIAACSTVPFLGAHRLVIVEGLLESLSGRGRRGKKGGGPEEGLGGWSALADFLPSMPASTTLVLLDGGLRSPPPLLEALSAGAEVRHFPALLARDLPGWLQARARQLGVRLEPRAASLIAQLAGNQKRERPEDEYNDLWALANELEKLAAAAPGGVISEGHVLELTPVLREQKGYYLRDALLEGRPREAARLLRELMEQGDSGQGLIGMMAAAYRQLAVARELVEAGRGAAALAAVLNVKGYAAEKLAEHAAAFPLERIRWAYRRIVQADLEVKSGECEEGLALELLVQELAGAARRRAA